MIATGRKTEEYRDIKPYYNKLERIKYDAVLFRNGYSKDSNTLLVKIDCIEKGRGCEEWGAPIDRDVYIIELGKVLEYNGLEVCGVKTND